MAERTGSDVVVQRLLARGVEGDQRVIDAEAGRTGVRRVGD